MKTDKENSLQKAIDQLAGAIIQKLETIANKPLAVTAKEAARLVGCSEWFIHDLIRRGEIAPIVKLGNRGLRIPIKTLEEFVERGGVKSA